MIQIIRADAGPSAVPFASTFLVTQEVRLRLEGGRLTYDVVPVAPYEKSYPQGGDGPDAEATFLALDDGPVGRIDLARSWNGYAAVLDLTVAPMARRSGVGTALVRRAIAWAEEQGLPGVTLETQDTNVPACRLYERCGFRLAGFDADLYRGLDPASREVALFWYRHPDGSG